LNVLTAEDERRLGEEFHKQISEEAEFYDDPEVVAYVQGLTKRLAATCGRRDVEYRAHVVVSEEINAFAVPGGYLYVNVGLIRAAESESELAGVLGHEIGHVVARHGAKHMTQRLGLVALMEMVHGRDASKTAEIVGAVIAVGGQGLLLKYSREDELEADELGARNLYDSGIDPQGLARFFEKLQSASGARQSKMLRILSTHPPSEERIRKVREQIRTLPPRTGLTRDGARFRRIRGSLPTPSPEDGDA
jgi:predicted Zn-dependent protease